MTTGSQTPERDDSSATGASEAEGAKPVDFEKNTGAGPNAPSVQAGKDQPPDAAELVGTKRKDDDTENGGKAEPGSLSTEDLTTENDDGAG